MIFQLFNLIQFLYGEKNEKIDENCPIVYFKQLLRRIIAILKLVRLPNKQDSVQRKSLKQHQNSIRLQ